MLNVRICLFLVKFYSVCNGCFTGYRSSIVTAAADTEAGWIWNAIMPPDPITGDGAVVALRRAPRIDFVSEIGFEKSDNWAGNSLSLVIKTRWCDLGIY